MNKLTTQSPSFSASHVGSFTVDPIVIMSLLPLLLPLATLCMASVSAACAQLNAVAIRTTMISIRMEENLIVEQIRCGYELNASLAFRRVWIILSMERMHVAHICEPRSNL